MTTIHQDASTQQLSAEGLDVIKTAEGLRLDAYNDLAGVPTIGFGHTGDVALGDRITPGSPIRI